MTVDCSECHDLDLVDQEHAVGDQNALASSCITTMMITKGLRRRFSPSVQFSTARKHFAGET
jgi:hypothetical protein